MKKILINIFITLCLLGVIGIFAFYIIVLSGLFPNIQELWVTSAMTTMSHQWCATLFIDKDVIDDIMARTYVDDSNYETKVELMESANKEDYPFKFLIYNYKEDVLSEEKKYKDEGYEKLEDGVYVKEVSDTTWHGYLMLVVDPRRVSLADTRYQFTRGDTVKSMVENNNAIAGINAGGFADGVNYDSYGEVPSGLLIKGGEVIYPLEDTGEKYSVIGFNKDNILILGKMTMQEAKDKGVRDSIDFRPFLIVNNETVIKSGNGGWGIAPRTAIGQRKTGEVIFLVIDGRQPGYSIGVDLKVLQDTLYDEGCINAAMCDGGSSTVMYYKDHYINKPSLGHERYINNAWIIK